MGGWRRGYLPGLAQANLTLLLLWTAWTSYELVAVTTQAYDVSRNVVRSGRSGGRVV
jgi:hypothetical protein